MSGMKRYIIASVFVTVMLCSCGPQTPPQPPPQPEEALPASGGDADYITLIDDLNSARQTELYIQEHWKQKVGTEIRWSGKVFDVRRDRNVAKLYIAKSEKPRYEGYNVILYVPDLQAAGQLKKGEEITFTGVIREYDEKRGGIILIEVDSGELVTP